MPGFLSKLFRRKKTSTEEGSSSNKKVKGRRGKIKDKSLLHDPSIKSLATANSNDGLLRRNGSFANTDLTGRGSSSSREATDVKEAAMKLQEPARVLSPRTSAAAVPPQPAPFAKAENKTWADAELKLKVKSPTDENRNNSNSPAALSPRKSFQQLQQFDRNQTNHLSPHRAPPSATPMFTMSADLPKAQVNAMDEMNRSDASSSSFNLSTDAEDSEYESLKRRLGVMPPVHTKLNTPALDTSVLSGVSSPTLYPTDDEKIFPALQTDDDMTQATAPSVNSGTLPQKFPPKQTQTLLVPLPTPDDEPGRIQIFSATNETEEDMRAWMISPSTQASKDLSSSKSQPSPAFSFQNGSMFENTATPRTVAPTPTASSASGRNTPSGPRTNFTSPMSTASSTDFSGSNDFANFADFSNFGSNDLTPWSDASKSDKQSPSPRSNFDHSFGGGFDRERDRNFFPSTAPTTQPIQQDTSLSELLAQAKGKRRSGGGSRASAGRTKPSSSSVNSAPAITSSYLRQHHNLHKYSSNTYGDRELGGRPSTENTSVSDIIQSLEATNQSRLKTNNYTSHHSIGESGAVSTVRTAKERLREKRRREREYNATRGIPKSKSSEMSSSDTSENEASESWLFDEVTGALGPRGIAADLESLSGRSNRSKNSSGNKSHKSHRSHRSHKSKTTRRRHRSSNESVDSRGSRTSRNSRYSHRSTKSFLSQMSEQSRSVANDLLRLEMQLAMVGSQENRDDVPARAGGSVGGASIGTGSRASRTTGSRKSMTSHRTHSSAVVRRSKNTVVAPPGKLGIILANKADSKGTVVSGVRTSSVLADKISPGDRIIAIDGEDVSRMTVSEITTIMARKGDFERVLTVLTTPKHLSIGPEPVPLRSPAKASAGVESFDNSFQHYRR